MTARYFVLRLLPYIAVWFGLHVFASAWFALLAYHIGVVLVLLLTKQFAQVVKLKPSWYGPSFAIASIAGVSAGGILFVLWPALHISPSLASSLNSLGLDSNSFPYFIAYFALVNPLLEEVYWRGFLGNASRRVLLDDVWFAAYHLLILAAYTNYFVQLLALCGLIFAAWMWRQIVNRTGSFFAPVISHMLADFSILSTVYLRTIR